MKRLTNLLINLFGAMAVVEIAVAQPLSFNVKVTNAWDEAKSSEPVVIQLHQIKKLNFHVSQAIVTQDGQEIPSQLDDMDGDWRADELVFLTDIAPHAVQTFSVTLRADSLQHRYTPRVYAHMSISPDAKTDLTAFETPGDRSVFNNLYHHGAAFESELVGFRIYSDARQNVDIYGKKTHRLELAHTMFNSKASHLKDGYGHDVLWNGGSIACGTLRNLNPFIDLHQHPDSLRRRVVPAEITRVSRRGQHILAYGPLRTVVEMQDFGWNPDGRHTAPLLCCRTRYTLYAGHRDVLVEATFDTPLHDELFCTGVQKIGTAPTGQLRADGLVMSWGSDYPDYGKKDLYPAGAAGLAVYVPPAYIYTSAEDSLNYLYILQAKGCSSFHYWLTCCADMEQDSPYHSAETWFDSLDHWKNALQHPVKVTVSRK